mgnify:CR=1 FL=1
MAEYTSNQYKYLLVKRLQRHFSMNSAYDRAYTQSFFWELFDDTVTVTEESYNNFCRLMDDEIALCAEKGWYRCEDIPTDAIKEQEVVLVKAFEAIGITLKIDSSSDNNNYLAIFTKPNSEIMTYKVGKMGNLNYFYINARAGTEYHYAVASAPAYNMQGMDVPQELGNPKSAGPGTYWSYNAGTKTMTISGDGAYIGVSNEEQIGSGKYTTVIIGANVSRLLKGSVTRDETTMVLLHPADGAISIDPDFNATSSSCGATKMKTVVYTDCAAAIAALSTEEQSKYVTLHSLSEWEG